MTTNAGALREIAREQLPSLRRDPVDARTLAIASEIVKDVRARGEVALREHAERLGDLAPGQPLLFSCEELAWSLEAIPKADRELLERTAKRIRAFAEAQRASIVECEVAVPGGAAGQIVAPMERAGCYAPGGRFPLPSSVLMTAVTARTAGVKEVIVASPKPTPHALAAAAVAGADLLLAAGGAQAIAAMAYGAGSVPACDAVVGPGNRFVTAAKQLVAGRVAIDMLAGPSELTVLADASASPEVVALDLLAQAEHDPDAVPILVAFDQATIDAVNAAIAGALAQLPTRSTAEQALRNGFAVIARDLAEAVAICDQLAPEHLSLQIKDAGPAARRFTHYGALFIGPLSAEAIGDYGAGPNHTLPTGGTARFSGGLSVFHFLRIRTWLRLDDRAAAAGLLQDAQRLGEIEGLIAHARSAGIRLKA